MTSEGRQRNGSIRSKIAAVLLSLFVLSLTSACRSKVFSENEIGVPEMARLVVSSMLNLTDAETYFYQIPEKQRDDMSFSEYYEYVSILIKMLPNGSKISGFDIVYGSEKNDLIARMLENGTDEYQAMYRSCVPIKVSTNRDRLSATPIYFYLQQKDDGTVFLSRQWARRCMNIYAYSVHYFEAYQNGNLGDVVSLLKNSGIDESLKSSSAVLSAKAKEMIRFYSSNVKTEFSGYELCYLDAANLLYMQPEVFDTQLQTKARYVQFSYNDTNEISVDDAITSELKTADLYLYYNGHRAIRIGENATAAQIQTFLGAPVSVSCGPVIKTEKRWGSDEVSYRNILVRYKGFAITIYGIYNDESDWEGNFVHFRIWDTSKVTIGTAISSDSTTWDILERYPFADMTDYDLEVSVDNERYELSIQVEQPEDASEDNGTKNEEGGLPISEILLAWRRSN